MDRKLTAEVIGESELFRQVLGQASLLAKINRPVLIYGERGTGKELVAERLHFLSERWEAPLVKLNCAALSESLLDSELFGHEAGAFTGAQKQKKGKFELSDGGTLFLDEVARASLTVQEKILRVIEYGQFERIGGQKTIKIDVRIVAACNEDLREWSKEGRFRSDLLDRLTFDVISIPPLRKRKEDIEPLAQYFGRQCSAEWNSSYYPRLSNASLQSLTKYSWPGNIRELKNVIERSTFYAISKDQSEIETVLIDPFPLSELCTKIGAESEEKSSSPRSLEEWLEVEIQNKESFSYDEFRKSCDRVIIEKVSSRFATQRRQASYLGMSYDQFRGLVRKYTI